MKRRAKVPLILLAIGLLLNVGIAWAFMLRHEGVAATPLTTQDGAAVDWIDDYRQTSHKIYNTTSNTALGITIHRIGGLFFIDGDEDVRLIAGRVTTGFPMSAMAGGYWHIFGADAPGGSERHIEAVTIDSFAFGQVNDGEFIPLRPLWPGFLINTLFYAAITWLLLFAPFALRRKLRIKRGLCPACAYPVGISNICTECGRAVAHVRPSSKSP